MANTTKIKWADSTVNPVMGCDGCQLSPPPDKVAKDLVSELVRSGINQDEAKAAVNTAFGTKTLTILRFHRKKVAQEIVNTLTKSVLDKAEWSQEKLEKRISDSVKCYAHVLHTRYGPNPDV